MKKTILLAGLMGLSLVSCKKDDDPQNNSNDLSLSEVIDGVWEVSNIKRTSDIVIQGVPQYLDFTTDSIYQPSNFIFSDSLMTAEVEYRYSARDAGTNTPYSSGWISIDGDYSVVGNRIEIYSSTGDTSVFNASSISQNSMNLTQTEVIEAPGIQLTETNTEIFTLGRIQ